MMLTDWRQSGAGGAVISGGGGGGGSGGGGVQVLYRVTWHRTCSTHRHWMRKGQVQEYWVVALGVYNHHSPVKRIDTEHLRGHQACNSSHHLAPLSFTVSC